jgi:cell division protein FtsQ
VAFARVGTKIMLTDAAGTLMDLPGRKKYSFPVIVGMNNGEPPSTRGARMKIYNDVVSQLDASGARYSQELSEIDLSDPEDVKVMANHHAGEVLVHLGSSNYLERYKIYVTHLQEWQQQFDKLESVDLRYDRQIIVNPDLQGPAKQPPLSTEAAKRAMAAGVKPAALITRIPIAPRPSPTLAVKTVGPSPSKPTPAKPVASVKVVKAEHHKPRVRWARSSTKGRAKVKPRSAAIAKTQPRPALKSAATVKLAAKPSPAIAKGETQ